MIASLSLALALSATPQDCLWKAAQDSPLALVETQSVVLGGKLYLMGGFFTSLLLGTPRTDVYDPIADTWTSLAGMPTIVTHHTAAVDDTQIWVAGGFFGDDGGFVVAEVQVYDSMADKWSLGPRLPARRAGGGMVRLGRKLHYFGGFSTRRLNADDHYVLDLDKLGAGWDSSSYAPLPMGRGHLSAVVLNGWIYAIGGQFGHDLNPIDLDLVHRFDPATNTWTQVASLPTPRSHFEASSFAYKGRIYVAGGRNNQPGGAGALQEVTAYDPTTDSWSEVSQLPLPLIGPSAKPIGDVLYVTGGGLDYNLPVMDHFRRAVDPVLGDRTRLNAGGPKLSLAQDWCLDSFFASGLSGVSLGTPAIAGTLDDALYHSERSSLAAEGARFSYHLPVADGDYRLSLHFAEYAGLGIGTRVFDILLEGVVVLDDYDITQSVGALSADVRVFDVEIQDGFLDLEFVASAGQAKLSALELEQLASDSFGVFCTGAPNSVGSGARLSFVGSTSVAQGNCCLLVSGLPPGKLARFALGTGQGSLPFGSGVYCLSGSMLFSPIQSVDAAGSLSIKLPTGLIPVGPSWNFQVMYQDCAPFNFNTSDALQLRFTP